MLSQVFFFCSGIPNLIFLGRYLIFLVFISCLNLLCCLNRGSVACREANLIFKIPLTPQELIVESFHTNNATAFNELLKSQNSIEPLNLPSDELGGETLMTYVIRNTPNDATSLQHIALLLKNGIDPTHSALDGATPLLASLENRDKLVTMHILEYFLEYATAVGPNNVIQSISISNNIGQTPLCEALVTEQMDVVDLLLDLGVTHLCRHSEIWCCNPVLLAISAADGVVVKRLLFLYPEATGFLSEALDLALTYGREDIIYVLLQHITRTSDLRYPAEPVITEAKDRVEHLLFAIETGRDEVLVDSMLELETSWKNSELCSVVNTEGRSLLFNAIYYGYRKVTERLIAFYQTMLEQKYTGYIHCYADKADRVGQCPSSVLVQSQMWNDKTEKRNILFFLFSRRHPISGENCFQNALLKKEDVVSIFRDIGDYVVHHYGPEILDLAGVDAAKKDILISAIESRAPQPVIILILQWLSLGSSKGVSNYFSSLTQGLLVAAGGTENWEDPFFETETYPDVIDAAAIVCPGVLYRLLFNIPLSNPSNELPYRQIINALSGPFPNFRESPLSASVKSSLDTFSVWRNISFLQELLGSHYEYRFTHTHFTYALDVAANSEIVRGDMINLHDASHRSFSLFHAFMYSTAIYLRKLTDSPLYAILPDKRVVTRRRTPRELFLRYYSIFMKRETVIVKLLLSPLAKPNATIERLSFYLFCVTLGYGLFVFISHGIFIAQATRKGSLVCFLSLYDITPCASSSWFGAFLEGVRRSFLIPRTIKIKISTETKRVTRCFLYLSHILAWFYSVAFLWCAVEIWVLTYDTNNQETCLGKLPSGLAIIYISPLRYIFPCTVLVHTVLSKVTCPEQMKWIAWLVFGQSVCGVSKVDENSVLSSFYWLIKSQRDMMSYRHLCERLPVYRCIRDFPLRFNMDFILFREYIQREKRRSLYQKCIELLHRYCLQRKFHSHSLPAAILAEPAQIYQFRDDQVSPCRRLSTPKTCKRVNKQAFLDDFEDTLILSCVSEFGKAFKASYTRELIFFYVSCFVVAQFPLWRCLSGYFKLFYFDIYFSEARFRAYMTSRPGTLLLREFIIFVVLWQELIQLGYPILLGLRLIVTMRQVARALKKRFPIKMKNAGISTFKDPSSPFATFNVVTSEKKSTTSPLLLTKSTIASVRVYIDVRQSLFKQFAYVWEPIETTLNLFCLYWCSLLVIMYPYFYCGSLRQHFFSAKYYQLGSQIFLTLFWIEWLAVQGLRANTEFDTGWIAVQCLNLKPDNLASYRQVRELQFQALNFFKPREFRLALASFRLNKAFAVVYLFLYTAFLVEFTLSVRTMCFLYIVSMLGFLILFVQNTF